MENPKKRTKTNNPTLKEHDDLQFEGLHLDRQSEDGRARVYKNDEGKPSETLLVFDA